MPIPWREPETVKPDPVFQAEVGGHPLVAQALWQRGLKNSSAAGSFLDPEQYQPASPYDLPGLEKAVVRIEHAIQNGETIGVWGDFDVDGQTSTTVLVSTLKRLGARVEFHIPVRARESHGINLPNLQLLMQKGITLLLTCDTGISAMEPIAYAQNHGVDVLVTDHHDLPDTLPPAFSITNPKLLPSGHPLGTLPGVGVAYKLAEAMLQRAGCPEEIEKLQDLVGLGIVADLAQQTGEARFLVQKGLQVLRRAERPGLRAIMRAAEINPANLTEEHIGFYIGPRLNALGRLDDANQAVEFLSTDDEARANLLAEALEGLNAKRKLDTDQILAAALDQIARDPALLDEPALILSQPAWETGVIGIVASALVERYNRPVILLSTPPGELARGSARSVEGVNITAAIAAQSSLLSGFGGHPMAAGLSLPQENLLRFKRSVCQSIQAQIDQSPSIRALQIAGYVSLSELTIDLVDDLNRLAPFGPGNPPLILAARDLDIQKSISVGRGDEHRQVILSDLHGKAQKVIWWRGAAWPLPQGRIDLAFTVHASNYRGQREVSVAWVDYRQKDEAIIAAARHVREVIDYRGQAHPLPILQQLLKEGPLQVWREGGEARERLEGGVDRTQLEPGDALAIWTTPPGPNELSSAIERVNPKRVYLFGVDPDMESQEAFLMGLAGLVKYSINHAEGHARLALLAARTAQRENTVRKGLAWLSARGSVKIKYDNDWVTFEAARTKPAPETQQLADQVKELLSESSAYRSHFHRADAETLVS